ncbi:cation:proton antiporter [Candidatus Woesebacteria bacterium]|nr:cation:proton antiporter [Candidatus Woesebacteria bacterium]
MEVFYELAVVLALITASSFVMRLLKQPLVVGYILTGILVGPYGLNVLHSEDTIELFSKLGIALLLFIVGLHLNPRVIKEVGSVSLMAGVGQVLFTSSIGFIIALLLNLGGIAALYISIALTFSSTIIILKLLSDKGDLQTLYGKIAIGMLLVQDLIATMILIVVSSIGHADGMPMGQLLVMTAGKGLLLGIAVIACVKWCVPFLVRAASKSTELLFVFSLAWGFGLASVFQYLGFSVEIGALVAGVALSATSVAEEVSSRMRPLRDFFIILFFVLLGSSLLLEFSAQILVPVLIFSLFVLVGNPVIVILLMNLLGYHKKVGFLTGLTVAQISEFSLILASLGFQIGHLSQDVVTIVTLVGLVTIAGSTYLILYSQRIYPMVQSLLTALELRKPKSMSNRMQSQFDVILFGFNRAGHDFLQLVEDLGYSIAVVDFDPETAIRLPKKGVEFFFGDAGNTEFLMSLPLEKAQLIISTIPSHETNVLVVKHCAALKKGPAVVAFAQHKSEALALYDSGAAYVVLPQHVGAQHILSLIKRVGFSVDSFVRRKENHLKELAQRAA